MVGVSVIIRRLIARLWGWSGISGVDDIFHQPYFRLWHLADIDRDAEHVRSRGQSGHSCGGTLMAKFIASWISGAGDLALD